MIYLFCYIELSHNARFRALLHSSDYVIDESVMSRIFASGWLSSRLAVVADEKQAMALYDDAEKVPQSQTRAEVLENSSVKIDGDMAVYGVQTAMFFHAFENDIPMVLKVPNSVDKVHAECELFAELGNTAIRDNLAMVPVRSLKLVGEHTKRHSPVKKFNQGILMPIYACTLSNVPKPISTEYALTQGMRLRKVIDYIHSQGWIHGDIKPGNIFLSADGNAWLGDYGSAIKRDDTNNFTGGTPKYQCHELIPLNAENSLKFDYVGLLLSLLDRLDVCDLNGTPASLENIGDALSNMEDSDLKTFLLELL